MSWAELTLDVVDASGVHEVIAWAEDYLVEFAHEGGQNHTYCLHACLPSDVAPADGGARYVWLLHIAGRNPTSTDEFERAHPFN